MGLIRFRDTSR